MYSAVFWPGRTPRNVAASLLEVVGHVDRVEDHRRVEEREEHDESHVDHVVAPLGGQQRNPGWTASPEEFGKN